VFLGVSPRMNEFCWHNGNVKTLFRYAKNRLKHLFHDEDADVSRLPMPEPPVPAEAYAKAVGKVMPEK